MAINCGSWFNTAYIYIGIPFFTGLVILFVLLVTLGASSETQLGFVSATSLVLAFLTPFMIKSRIDSIKNECHSTDIKK